MTTRQSLFVPITVPAYGDIEMRKSVVRDLVSAMNKDREWNTERIQNAIKVTPFQLGLTNQLYKCELEKDKMELDEKKFDELNMEVMVRVFGEGSEEMLNREEEIHIMQQVNEDYVKCRFNNGIVVTFFPGECLRPRALTDSKNMKKIAEKMAFHHQLVLMNQNNEPSTLNWFSRVNDWISIIKKKLPDYTLSIPTENLVITPNVLQNDLLLLKKYIDKKNYKSYFCHGDVNAENCIYFEKDDSITFIDYEYACNFFSGFDIGNHFCEYAGVETNLDFKNCFPSEDTRKKFVKYYCEHRYPNDENAIDKMMEAADDGALLSHFFWGVWGIIQSTCSQLEFDFKDYGEKRLFEFYNIKSKSSKL